MQKYLILMEYQYAQKITILINFTKKRKLNIRTINYKQKNMIIN